MHLQSVFHFLNTGRYAFLRYIVSHQRATLQWPYVILYTRHRVIMQQSWQSLCCLSVLVFYAILAASCAWITHLLAT